MRAQEAKAFTNIDATTAGFTLGGGNYVLAVSATFGGGNVGVEVLLPDGATWVDCHTPLTAAGITAALALPPGQYRIAIATATGVTCSLVRVPAE